MEAKWKEEREKVRRNTEKREGKAFVEAQYWTFSRLLRTSRLYSKSFHVMVEMSLQNLSRSPLHPIDRTGAGCYFLICTESRCIRETGRKLPPTLHNLAEKEQPFVLSNWAE